MTGIIDSHQHFWNPTRGDYGWMPEDHPILSRAYGPVDLAPILDTHGVDQTIIVQAAPTIAETEYMLGIADATPSVAGVVGWIDFEKPSDAVALKRLAQHQKFLGVRPMIQDIPDETWMLRDDIQWAYELLCDLDLTFDALGFPQHMAHFHTIAERYPAMRVVLNHCMKPQIRDHSPENFKTWSDQISRLADETQAFCKLSGIVTEADGWSLEKLAPYVHHVIEAFGAERVMWGSDWPVCRLEAEYDAWLNAATTLLNDLPESARADVFGGTARRFYRI